MGVKSDTPLGFKQPYCAFTEVQNNSPHNCTTCATRSHPHFRASVTIFSPTPIYAHASCSITIAPQSASLEGTITRLRCKDEIRTSLMACRAQVRLKVGNPKGALNDAVAALFIDPRSPPPPTHPTYPPHPPPLRSCGCSIHGPKVSHSLPPPNPPPPHLSLPPFPSVVLHCDEWR